MGWFWYNLSMPQNTAAFILAGGNGTRILGDLEKRKGRPLTEDEKIPKSMFEIDDVPMIVHQLRQVARAGITDITILEGFKAKIIQDYLGDGSSLGLHITHLVLDQRLQSGGAIKSAIEQTRLSNIANFLVLYGDIISNVDLGKLVEQHIAREALVTAVTIPKKSDYGIWQKDRDGRAVSFQEKPPEDTNSAIFAVNRAVTDFITVKPNAEGVHEGKDFFGGTVVPIMNSIMNLGNLRERQGSRGTSMIQTFDYKGPWWDVADLGKLEEAQAHLSEWELPALSPNPSSKEHR